uniref:Disintegrin domain-containing protein n=1 Tax=Chromera velia CCMP2878 TaxID=1169474 RepID=A0A0G4I2G0_9ALVE|eukprot:Cvel_1711.t1-p1 / transcript=Cvel_1711.t1 / gene=Cvel_1711 / organism=Chromera_velia_CCMP2878 / gene_product=Prestalk protein, putative / transcript_product=Prestalk protein, putative / location=Cvel_scaffold61:146972-153585(+) / protein_length=1154 / sequence_SO=supercontig / SO=protein_coding / is_pseudo=false
MWSYVCRLMAVHLSLLLFAAGTRRVAGSDETGKETEAKGGGMKMDFDLGGLFDGLKDVLKGPDGDGAKKFADIFGDLGHLKDMFEKEGGEGGGKGIEGLKDLDLSKLFGDLKDKKKLGKDKKEKKRDMLGECDGPGAVCRSAGNLVCDCGSINATFCASPNSQVGNNNTCVLRPGQKCSNAPTSDQVAGASVGNTCASTKCLKDSFSGGNEVCGKGKEGTPCDRNTDCNFLVKEQNGLEGGGRLLCNTTEGLCSGCGGQNDCTSDDDCCSPTVCKGNSGSQGGSSCCFKSQEGPCRFSEDCCDSKDSCTRLNRSPIGGPKRIALCCRRSKEQCSSPSDCCPSYSSGTLGDPKLLDFDGQDCVDNSCCIRTGAPCDNVGKNFGSANCCGNTGFKVTNDQIACVTDQTTRETRCSQCLPQGEVCNNRFECCGAKNENNPKGNDCLESDSCSGKTGMCAPCLSLGDSCDDSFNNCCRSPRDSADRLACLGPNVNQTECCVREGGNCTSADDCCPFVSTPNEFFQDPSPVFCNLTSNTCERCTADGGSCGQNEECCSEFCNPSTSTCDTCAEIAQTCADSDACCPDADGTSPIECDPTTNQCRECVAKDARCSSTDECCNRRIPTTNPNGNVCRLNGGNDKKCDTCIPRGVGCQVDNDGGSPCCQNPKDSTTTLRCGGGAAVAGGDFCCVPDGEPCKDASHCCGTPRTDRECSGSICRSEPPKRRLSGGGSGGVGVEASSSGGIPLNRQNRANPHSSEAKRDAMLESKEKRERKNKKNTKRAPTKAPWLDHLFGFSLAFSHDCSLLAVGEPGTDEQQGAVSVYRLRVEDPDGQPNPNAGAKANTNLKAHAYPFTFATRPARRLVTRKDPPLAGRRLTWTADPTKDRVSLETRRLTLFLAASKTSAKDSKSDKQQQMETEEEGENANSLHIETVNVDLAPPRRRFSPRSRDRGGKALFGSAVAHCSMPLKKGKDGVEEDKEEYVHFLAVSAPGSWHGNVYVYVLTEGEGEGDALLGGSLTGSVGDDRKTGFGYEIVQELVSQGGRGPFDFLQRLSLRDAGGFGEARMGQTVQFEKRKREGDAQAVEKSGEVDERESVGGEETIFLLTTEQREGAQAYGFKMNAGEGEGAPVWPPFTRMQPWEIETFSADVAAEVSSAVA